MGRTRNVAEVAGMDEERVELRVRLHILQDQGGSSEEIEVMRGRIALLGRQITALRALERKNYHSS